MHTGKNDADVGHEFAVLMAVGDENGKNVDGEERAPKEERAFLTGPESRDFVEGGKVAVGVRDHVGHREVVREEEILEANGGDENQDTGGYAGLAGALDQEGMARFDGRDAADESINGAHKCEQKRKTAKYIHKLPRLPLGLSHWAFYMLLCCVALAGAGRSPPGAASYLEAHLA